MIQRKRPTRKSYQRIDQVFVRGLGWCKITPMQIRHLWWKRYARLARHAEAVHVVERGDYLLTELR